MSDTDAARRYRQEMGHDSPDAGDHPLAAQWDYKGTREERDALAADLEERDEQPTQEESLF